MKTKITIAKLDNGKEVEYDNCSLNKEDVDLDNFNFIGEGIIYKVNGVKQNYTEKFFFFVYSLN